MHFVRDFLQNRNSKIWTNEVFEASSKNGGSRTHFKTGRHWVMWYCLFFLLPFPSFAFSFYRLSFCFILFVLISATVRFCDCFFPYFFLYWPFLSPTFSYSCFCCFLLPLLFVSVISFPTLLPSVCFCVLLFFVLRFSLIIFLSLTSLFSCCLLLLLFHSAAVPFFLPPMSYVLLLLCLCDFSFVLLFLCVASFLSRFFVIILLSSWFSLCYFSGRLFYSFHEPPSTRVV